MKQLRYALLGACFAMALVFFACESKTDKTGADATMAIPESIPPEDLWMPEQFSMHLKFRQPNNPWINRDTCWESEECNFYYKFTDDLACMKAEFNGFCPPLPGAPQLNTAHTCWIYAMRYKDRTTGASNYAAYYIQIDPEGRVLSCCAFTPDIGPVRRNFLVRAATTPWLLVDESTNPHWETVPSALTEISGIPAQLMLTSNQIKDQQDPSKKAVQGNFAVAYEPTQVGDSSYHAPLYIAGHSPWLVPNPKAGDFIALNMNPYVPDSSNLYRTAFGQMEYYDFDPVTKIPDEVFALPEECNSCRDLIEGPATPETYAKLKANCSCWNDGMIMNIPGALPGTGSCTTCHENSDKWQHFLTDSTFNVAYDSIREIYRPAGPKLTAQEVKEIAELFRGFETPCKPGPTVPF